MTDLLELFDHLADRQPMLVSAAAVLVTAVVAGVLFG